MSKSNGMLDRIVKKIKYIRKKKLTRNNIRAKLKKDSEYKDY